MKKFLLVLVSLMITAVSFAQVTTSGISGKVTDQNGQALIGATVIAVHTPSGTEYGAATNLDGRYTIQGMRTGGPYTVTMTFVGYTGVETTDITLKLGDVFTLNNSLKESQMLDEVVVTSTGADRFNNNKTGAASNFSASAIAATPSVDRSVFDVVKMTPQANVSPDGGIVFAGASNRYNSFQVDGAMNNDVFGLSDTGTNGGQSSPNPISLDAIEAVQVVVAPFDVRQGGFTGGGINAITKSGTNDFQGSVYSYFNNQDFIGSTAGEMSEGAIREKLAKQMTNTYGVTAGGSIIEDKLFFFVSGEYYNQARPTTYNAGDEGFISVEDAERIAAAYKKLTGFDDNLVERTLNTNSKDFMARIDWNINKNNNLMFRYQLKDATKDDGYASKSYANFNNSGFSRDNNTHTFVVELNSRISNELSNEFRAGYTIVRDERTPSTVGPTIVIKYVDGVDKQVNLGTEYSSGLNKLNQDILTITDNFSIYKGNHAITVGTHNEIYKMANGFLQNAYGSYTYNGIEDFENGKASSYALSYCDPKYTNGDARWMAQFSSAQFGLYVQDEWKPTTDFTLTYGVRADLPVMFTTPQANDKFNESGIANNGEHMVGRAFKSRILWSPRVGFRYFTDDNHSSLLRGGVGIFTGRVPFVWFSNIYGNTGLEIKKISIGSKDADKIPDFTMTPEIPTDGTNTSVNTIDENFRLPQVLRANLAWEKSFTNGWSFTLEGLYSKTLNNVSFNNVAYEHTASFYPVAMGVGTTAPRYTPVDAASGYEDAINLENTNKGYTYDISALVNKHFNFGLDLSASYSFGHSYSVNDAGSSVAYSNWYKNISVDANSDSELSFSRYDVPHRINVSATYVSPVYANNRMNTVVGLTYQGHSGARYSLGYDEYYKYVNGDTAANTLLYIPTDSEIDQMTFLNSGKYDSNDFTEEENRAAFKEWCNTDKYAKAHRGEWAERYGSQNPFEHHFNVHIAQNYYYNVKKRSKIELSLDILNVGNMFNREWGTYTAQPYPGVDILTVNATEVDGDKNLAASYVWKGEQTYQSDFISRWRMQAGLRVTF